jgi:hypothetical protein
MLCTWMQEHIFLLSDFDITKKQDSKKTGYIHQSRFMVTAHKGRKSTHTSVTDKMLLSRDVKGATTRASASLKAMPTWTAFRAPQSLPPSPHMRTIPTLRMYTRLEFKLTEHSVDIQQSSTTISITYDSQIIKTSLLLLTFCCTFDEPPVYDKIIPYTVKNKIRHHQRNKHSTKLNRHNGCIVDIVDRNRIRRSYRTDNIIIVTVQAPNTR